MIYMGLIVLAKRRSDNMHKQKCHVNPRKRIKAWDCFLLNDSPKSPLFVKQQHVAQEAWRGRGRAVWAAFLMFIPGQPGRANVVQQEKTQPTACPTSNGFASDGSRLFVLFFFPGIELKNALWEIRPDT